MFSATPILLIGSILLFISIIGSKTSLKIGVPTLIIFLGIGMLAGTDGFGIQFDNTEVTQVLGIVALNFILFSGGLETKVDQVRPVIKKGLSLATFGVFFTTLLIASFVYYFTDFTFFEAMLLGAIVSSTDAAAVFSIFRTKKIGLRRKIKDVIELESASNDPMAYFLTIALISLVQNPDQSLLMILPHFLMEMGLGSLVGGLGGWLFLKLINRIRLDIDGLYPVLLLAITIFIYSLSMYIGGNGFLAVYITALIFGNNQFVHKRSIVVFYDGIAWLMQIAMFLTLGLLVTPSEMLDSAGLGIALSAFLILLARPLSVFISLSFFKMPFRDKFFVSWCGLRGAVPIVFATYPLIAGIDKADIIFHVVFYITVSSMLIQGTSFAKVSDWLGLAKPEEKKKQFMFNEQDDFRSELQEIMVCDENFDGKTIVDLEIPEGGLIVYVKRGKQYITPRGNTEINVGDKLLLIATDQKIVRKVSSLLGNDIND